MKIQESWDRGDCLADNNYTKLVIFANDIAVFRNFCSEVFNYAYKVTHLPSFT